MNAGPIPAGAITTNKPSLDTFIRKAKEGLYLSIRKRSLCHVLIDLIGLEEEWKN